MADDASEASQSVAGDEIQEESIASEVQDRHNDDDSDDGEWNVDQFRDIKKMPLHNMQKNLSYIKRKCKAQLDALNAIRGREEVDSERYKEVAKAFVSAEIELTERRAFDAAKCIIEMENDTGMLQSRGMDTEIRSWTVEHFVARKKNDGSTRYQRREFAIFINEDSVKHYKGLDKEDTELRYNSPPHVWLQLLRSVYSSLLVDCTSNARTRQQRGDSKDVRQFIFIQEEEGPSFMNALESAAKDAEDKKGIAPGTAAVALFPGVSDADLGAASESSYSFDAGDRYKLKYRLARLSNRNTQIDQKVRAMAPGNSMVNEETSQFFNEKIAPRTLAKWGEIELRLHGSTHFIRFLRTPRKTNYVMVYPFVAKSDNEDDETHFRDKNYNQIFNPKPYAIKTPWIPGRTAVARLSEVDTMVEAMQCVKELMQRSGEITGYKSLKGDEKITELIDGGKAMKDHVRVYYSIQDEYFGQWTVWFAHYKSQIIGVQLYYPSLAMLHASKHDKRREVYNVNGTPHKHWSSTPVSYFNANGGEWPSIKVEVMSRWHVMTKLNGTYAHVYTEEKGHIWYNADSGISLGAVFMQGYNFLGDDRIEDANMNIQRWWMFYNHDTWFAFVDGTNPLNVNKRWTNCSQIPDRNSVRINIRPVTLPPAVGSMQQAKGPAPHTIPDVHLGAVMESLGEIRRALNHTALLKGEALAQR